MSHPMWVRGLKQKKLSECKTMEEVAPYVGAWIETACIRLPPNIPCKSHPMWVRGLKHYSPAPPYGRQHVAPYVGAWIETFYLA